MLCEEIEPLADVGVMRVLSGESVSPRSFRNASTNGRTSFSSNSRESPVMMKSSAYRTRLTLGDQYLPSFHFTLGKWADSKGSSPSKVKFASVGEITPPCGYPPRWEQVSILDVPGL